MRSQIVSKALAWVGQSFRPGVSAQCAAWISYLLSALGFGPALYPPHQWRQEQGYTWAPYLNLHSGNLPPDCDSCPAQPVCGVVEDV